MSFTIKKSKTFKGKFEVRKNGRFFASDLTMKQAKFIKRVASKPGKKKGR